MFVFQFTTPGGEDEIDGTNGKNIKKSNYRQDKILYGQIPNILKPVRI